MIEIFKLKKNISFLCTITGQSVRNFIFHDIPITVIVTVEHKEKSVLK